MIKQIFYVVVEVFGIFLLIFFHFDLIPYLLFYFCCRLKRKRIFIYGNIKTIIFGDTTNAATERYVTDLL